MKLYGFTILRNGLKYDYPFLESLRSLAALCEEVYVALGKSDDGTEKMLGEIGNLVIIPTVWDENLRQSGLILSQQTNIALEALRARHPQGWGIYLQADEVLNERDFARIRADVEAADAAGADALSFRYLHFWQSYHQIAIDRRWYPQEIRAIKLDSAAVSYGDAQSFQRVGQRYESDATVYHYGHVREAGAYERKKSDFHRWWHGDDEMKKVLARGEKKFAHEPTLPYFGPQPSFMRERIGASFTPVSQKPALVYGEADKFSSLLPRVRARLHWTSRAAKLLKADRESTVLLENVPLWARVLSLGALKSSVPRRMRSPQAREWTPEFQAVMRFSEKGIYVD